MPGPEQETKQAAAKEALNIIVEISALLNTQLTRKQLASCVSLIQNGVNPEALATVIKQLRANYPEEDEEAASE